MEFYSGVKILQSVLLGPPREAKASSNLSSFSPLSVPLARRLSWSCPPASFRRPPCLPSFPTTWSVSRRVGFVHRASCIEPFVCHAHRGSLGILQDCGAISTVRSAVTLLYNACYWCISKHYKYVIQLAVLSIQDRKINEASCGHRTTPRLVCQGSQVSRSGPDKHRIGKAMI